jgi:hypothetical protein
MSTPASPTSQYSGRERAHSRIQDYLSTEGYYTCISKEPLPLKWSIEEDSPAGIFFEKGNVVRMRSFVYKDPYLWAEVLSGGFVCAGIGDTRSDAADTLLEEYFEPYRLPGMDDRSDAGENRGEALRDETNMADATASREEARRASASSQSKVGANPSRSASVSSSSSAGDEYADAMAERITEIFRIFDKDGDGTITSDELKTVLQALDSRKWTDTKITQLMSIMDDDKDRGVDYEEFVHWICGTCRWRKERKEFFQQLGVQTMELKELRGAAVTHGLARRGSRSSAAGVSSSPPPTAEEPSQRRSSWPPPPRDVQAQKRSSWPQGFHLSDSPKGRRLSMPSDPKRLGLTGT